MISEDTLIIIILILLIFMVGYSYCADVYRQNNNEHMAPLNYGTYPNKYPRGECNPGFFGYSDCTVGNCPLDTPITNEQACYIQCAQGVGIDDYENCYNSCMNMMEYCR